MSVKIQNALSRLNSILPLSAQQQTLDRAALFIHKKILHSFVESGSMLSRDDIITLADNADAIITKLVAKDLITIDQHNNLIGAYPFTMDQRSHRVTVNGFTVHAMCALDALAISPMFTLPTTIESQCDISKSTVHIKQHCLFFQNEPKIHDVYFAINWNATSNTQCCANSLCTEMVFIKGHNRAEQWLAKDGHQREVFTLQEAVELASDFFVLLMQ